MRALPLLLALACRIGESPTDTPDDSMADTVVDTDTAGDTIPSEDTDTVELPGCPDGLPHTLETTTGCVLGTATETGEGFFGIPYAEAPIGPLRFERPVPITPWDDPLDGTTTGSPCLQSNGTRGLDGLEPDDGSEDCLTLNVMRPEGAEGLPLLFWTHGGGHTDGAGSLAVYADNPGLAEHAVLVTHNYRLGPFGFLAHPDLSASDPDGVSGNQGLRDSLLALQWALDNAEALGADPSRVLIFGESAGGVSTCAMWLSSALPAEVSRAITQSASCTAVNALLRDEPSPRRESGEDQGVRVAEAVGCTGPDAMTCLRDIDPLILLEAARGRHGILGAGEAWRPMVDGVLIPASFGERVAQADLPQTPIIATVNADEGWTMTQVAGVVAIQDEAAFRRVLLPYAFASGSTVDALIDIWNDTTFGSWADAYTAFVGDVNFVCPVRRMVQDAAPLTTVHALFFERARGPLRAQGPVHGAEVPYVFGTLPSRSEDQLSGELQQMWVDAAGATPVLPNDVPWLRYPGPWAHVTAGGTVSTIDDVYADRCAALFD